MPRWRPGWPPELDVLMLYYALSSAMLALPVAAVSLLLNRDLGLAARPERVSAYYAASFSVSTLKPLFGAVSDRFPARTWRRRGVMVPGCLLAALGSAALGALVHNEAALYAAGLSLGLGFCAAEAAADGALVEAAAGKEESVAALQVAAMSVRTAASALAGLLGAGLLYVLQPRTLLGVAAGFGAAAAIVSGLLTEPPRRHDVRESAEENVSGCQGTRLGNALRSAMSAARFAAVLVWNLRAAVAILLLLGAMPQSDDAYAAFVATGFEPPLTNSRLGLASACGSLGALVGTLAYGKVMSLMSRPSSRRMLTCGALVGSAGSLLRIAGPLGCLGLPPPDFVALAAFALGVTARLAFMPQLVLCAQLAPVGSEAAGFATLAVVTDLGALASAAVTASLTVSFSVGTGEGRNWRNLPSLVAVCACLRLVPVIFVPLLPARADGRAVEDEERAALLTA